MQLVKMHGIDILDDNPVRYPLELKQEAVERVLINNESRRQVSLDLGLVDTKLLRDWNYTFKQKEEIMAKKSQSTKTLIIKTMIVDFKLKVKLDVKD